MGVRHVWSKSGVPKVILKGLQSPSVPWFPIVYPCKWKSEVVKGTLLQIERLEPWIETVAKYLTENETWKRKATERVGRLSGRAFAAGFNPDNGGYHTFCTKWACEGLGIYKRVVSVDDAIIIRFLTCTERPLWCSNLININILHFCGKGVIFEVRMQRDASLYLKSDWCIEVLKEYMMIVMRLSTCGVSVCWEESVKTLDENKRIEWIVSEILSVYLYMCVKQCSWYLWIKFK